MIDALMAGTSVSKADMLAEPNCKEGFAAGLQALQALSTGHMMSR